MVKKKEKIIQPKDIKRLQYLSDQNQELKSYF
jgi:hypothetical protein